MTTSLSSRDSTSAAARMSLASSDSERQKALLVESDDSTLLRWIALQRKTFTAWANVHLSQRMLSIAHLENDLRDGLLLVHLLELLTGQTLLKVKKTPKSRIQQLQTVTVALDCLDAIGIRTQGISSFEIVEANLKIVLGVMWSLVCHFQIQDGGQRSVLAGKRALLLWVKNQVKQFDLPVTNFSAHFRDGRVLCALVDALVPGELNMKRVLAGGDDRKNLERALELAETSLDIPRIIDPDDLLVAKPDETSIMTYVSFFRMKWNKPTLAQTTIDQQRANLTVRPDRDAPAGTIRRLMQELEVKPTGGSAAAAAVPNPSIVVPVVVPESFAADDGSSEGENDDDDDDGDGEVAAVMKELEQSAPRVAVPDKDDDVNDKVPAATAAAPAVPVVSAPAVGGELRRAQSANRVSAGGGNPSALAVSQDSGSLRGTAGSLRRTEPQRVLAVSVSAATSDSTEDDAELDALLAEGDAEIERRTQRASVETPGVSSSSAAAAEKRPKVCEVCMTRKVAAKITPKGSTTPQFVCKPCAIDAAEQAKQRKNSGGPSSLAKSMDQSVHAKAADPVVVPSKAPEPIVAKAAEGEKKPMKMAAAVPLRKTEVPSTTAPTRKDVNQLPSFAATDRLNKQSGGGGAGSFSGRSARAPSTLQRVNATASPLSITAEQFDSSSLRVGKKAASNLKSRRQFRHSVIVQLPARPAATLPIPTPEGPTETDAERALRLGRLDRTKTRDSLYAAELMAQMEALLAEEGITANDVDAAPPAPDDGPPAELVKAAEAPRSVNARQLATLTNMWFYSDVTREATEDLLVAEDAGAFIVRPSAAEHALTLTYKAAKGELSEDLVLFDNGRWRFGSDPEATGDGSSVEALLRGDTRLAFERTREWRQRVVEDAVKDEGEDNSGSDMEVSARDSVIMAPSASIRASAVAKASGGTLSRAQAKSIADAAAAALGESFSLDQPLDAPGESASDAEKKRWTAYCDWLAAQNITLEEYAMRVRGASRDTAARLASEVTLRTVAQKGTDEAAAAETIVEKGAVRAELEDGAREIEIELADMATYVAVADYLGENDNELSFKEGQQVIVLGPDESGWWKAELNGQFGWVPAAFLERVGDKKAQVAPEVLNEAEIASAELAAAAVKPAEEPPSLANSGSSSSTAAALAAAQAEAAAAAAAADKEPALAEDGEVMYTQAIEDFVAEGEGELPFRRDDYVCALKPDPSDTGGWWKGQLPSGEFGWVPAEFLEVLPAKPKDWARRVPQSKSRATVKVDGLLQGNVSNEIREMEACEKRWGSVAAKFGKLWAKDASPTDVVAGGSESGEWQQRFCVLLKKERQLLELRSWKDEPTAALVSHHISTSLSSTHAARSFAFFVRTRKTAVLLAPIAADKEARIERDEWLAALAIATKSTLKAKSSRSKSSSKTKSRSSTSAALLKDAVLQGKLLKKSFGWSSRWFALLATGKLHWWDGATNATSGKPSKGSISLAGAHVGKPPNAGKHHAFYIKTASASLLMRAKTSDEADRWIAALEAMASKTK